MKGLTHSCQNNHKTLDRFDNIFVAGLLFLKKKENQLMKKCYLGTNTQPSIKYFVN